MQPANYIPIPVATLFPSKKPAFSLYIRDSEAGSLRLYRGDDCPVEKKDIDKLGERGIEQLYITSQQHPIFQNYLRENLDDVLKDESIPVLQRFENLNQFIRDVLADAFSKRNLAVIVETTKALAERTVDLISRDDCLAADVCQVLCHDSQLCTHSANVSYYCVLMARRLGIDGPEELKQIAAGGLLHDLGMLNIPGETLSKPHRLSDITWREVRRHPTLGFTMLNRANDLGFGQLMMVYQHHERLDGSGYPVRAAGQEIHEWGRLCAAADVYEAVTSDRPYRPAFGAEQALEIVEHEAGKELDESMVQCLKAIITRR